MKKLFAIAIAVVLTLALSISAFAGLDALYADTNTYQQNAGFATDAKVTINPGQKLFILGWFASHGKTVDKVVWTLDGDEKECSDVYRDRPEIADFFGGDWVHEDFTRAGFGKDDGMMELLGVDALAEGTYKVSIVGKYTDGSSEDIKPEFTLVVGNGEDAPATQNYVAVQQANQTDGIWLTKDGDCVGVEFTTNAAFNRVFLPSTWSSRKDNNRECNVVLNLYKFEYNAENSLSKAPVATRTYEVISDGNPLCELVLDEAAPAGTYIFTITASGEKLTGDTANGSAYFVMDHAIADADVSKVKFINTEKTIAFSVTGDIVEGDFFAANPEDTEVPSEGGDQPETVPQTGDATVAMFAVIAVLAMGAAVVFMKKRAF
ncbi:MAG: LPXTG cell wall anchor domain-containing protein [Clostridia bacterium]|nr:LPXTG cell wall anchor domain-containing protein [Clostridia bacterium]